MILSTEYVNESNLNLYFLDALIYNGKYFYFLK